MTPRRKKKRTKITPRMKERVIELKRKDPKLSLRDIARKVKISKDSVQNILNGVDKLSISVDKLSITSLENLDPQVVHRIQTEAKKKKLSESEYLVSIINTKPNYSAGTIEVEIDTTLFKRLEKLQKKFQARDISSVISMLYTLHERIEGIREEIG